MKISPCIKFIDVYESIEKILKSASLRGQTGGASFPEIVKAKES